MRLHYANVPVRVNVFFAALLATALHVPVRAGDLPLQNERLIWFFEFPTPLAGEHTAVAPDGTVYATDNINLYALQADGSLQWTANGAGGGRPIDIAPDGTIYTGGGVNVFAIQPDGGQLWSFALPDILACGPSLGPDGNLYGATDNDPNEPEEGLGAFSLDPTSPTPSLRWTNIGDPAIFTLTGSNLPVVFVADKAVMGVTTTGAGGAAIWAFDVDGNQDWFGSDLEPDVFGKPMADVFDRVLTSGGQSIIATAADGSNDWQTFVPEGVSGLLPPVSDNNGTIYTADTIGGERWALHPDGTTKYFADGEGGIVNKIGVSPDGSILLLGGNNFGEPGFVRAYDAQDGSPLWQVSLDPQGGLNEFVHSLTFSFSPDNRAAYFTTRVGANGDNGRLHAVQLSVAGDFDGDGEVGLNDWPDFVACLTGPENGPIGPMCSPADANDDDDVDLADCAAVLAALPSE